jgi:hypothetical protein
MISQPLRGCALKTPALFLSLFILCGGDPAVTEIPSTRQLIEQLSAPDFKVREVAAKSLETAGEAVLPALRQAQPHADPEVRKRLTQLIARLEKSFLLTPRLVTIKADQVPVGQVFADLARQTGYQLNCVPGNSDVVTINVDNAPFWEAMDQVCRQTGLGLQSYGNDQDGLTFHRVGQYSPYVCYSGQFRVAAAGFHLSRSLDLAVRQQFNPLNPPRSETLTMTFQVVGEPKASLMSLGQPRLTLAEDAFGNSLVPPQGRVYESNYHDYSFSPRNAVRQTQVQLHGPGAAQSLRLVKGTVPITFLAEKRPELTIDDVMNVKDKKFEGSQITLELHEVKESPGRQVTVYTTVRRNVGEGQFDYSWTNSLAQRIELLDDQGQKFVCEGFNWDSGNPTSVTGTFQFSDGGNKKLGRAKKLIYYNWIMGHHEVDFEFKDLPLP